MKTHLDWSAYDTYGIGDAFSGVPITGGNYAKAVAVCMHNRECQREGRGVMCPSFRITCDPAHSTEARVAAFKAALNGDLGPSPFTGPELAASLDLCVLCKGCKKECPSAVDMTLIKTEFLAQRNDLMGVRRRSRLLGGLPAWVGHWHRPVRALVRWRNRSPLLRKAAEKFLGLAARRRIPVPAAASFRPPAPTPAGSRGQVVLFVDTFAHHFEPEIAEAALEVLKAAGYGVTVARPASGDSEPDRSLCCGRTYLSTGQVEKARAEARRVLAALAPALEAGIPIIGLEPSCLLSMRDEFYSLGLGAEVARLGKQIFLLEEFLARESHRGLTLPLKPLPCKALIHGHCHQKAFGTMKSMRKVLGWIPDFQFEPDRVVVLRHGRRLRAGGGALRRLPGHGRAVAAAHRAGGRAGHRHRRQRLLLPPPDRGRGRAQAGSHRRAAASGAGGVGVVKTARRENICKEVVHARRQ
ncbi:MAG: 4Fe-4S dicluster domain-containing protein [Magnetospirillum sp.]|nr:4Fe-4S dicluster domain-containing protein [Magnetospirillum sp.]